MTLVISNLITIIAGHHTVPTPLPPFNPKARQPVRPKIKKVKKVRRPALRPRLPVTHEVHENHGMLLHFLTSC